MVNLNQPKLNATQNKKTSQLSNPNNLDLPVLRLPVTKAVTLAFSLITVNGRPQKSQAHKLKKNKKQKNKINKKREPQ